MKRLVDIAASTEIVIRSIDNAETLLRLLAHPDFDSLKKFDEDDWYLRAEWNKDYRGTLDDVLKGWIADHDRP